MGWRAWSTACRSRRRQCSTSARRPSRSRPRPSSSWPRRASSLWTTTCFFFSWYGGHRDLHSFPTRRSSDLVQEVQDQIKLRIATSITLLRAATGLFAASDRVNAGEFERFVHQIELEKNYKGVQGIGYARRFRADEMANIIARMDREKVANFKISPAEPPRDEYTVILYLQPLTPANNRAV